jgi:hypothetical protein
MGSTNTQQKAPRRCCGAFQCRRWCGELGALDQAHEAILQIAVIAELAGEGVGDGRDIRVVHTARGHALMLGTLKILATGLEPGMTYYYRFRLNDEYSPVGITFSSFKAPGVDYGKLMVEANDDVGHCNMEDHGYIRLTLTRDAADAEFIKVSDILTRDYRAGIESQWRVRPAVNGEVPAVERVG